MLQDEHHNRFKSYKWSRYVIRYQVTNEDGIPHVWFDYVTATCNSHAIDMFRDLITKKKWWNPMYTLVEIFDVFEKKGYYTGNYQGKPLKLK
jgi:hypothetical protein